MRSIFPFTFSLLPFLLAPRFFHMAECPESVRLSEDNRRIKNWKRWGPYLAERQWGTVREDYSANGDCWNYLPHDHARSRAYRWGEDGLLGWTDRECRMCFALALWNGADPILKERMFGLSNGEGNHGEDVKEAYFHLDGLPTHSYQRALYKYPQRAFPYEELVTVNRDRSKQEPEYEITDTKAFDENRYFDVEIEYAKAGPDDIFIRITATNRGPDTATLHLLPTLWFRNTWSWGKLTEETPIRPELHQGLPDVIEARHATLGTFHLQCGAPQGAEFKGLLFTENETNTQRLFGIAQQPALCEGRVPRGDRARQRGGREPGLYRHKGSGALYRVHRCGGHRGAAVAAGGGKPGVSAGSRLRRSLQRFHPGEARRGRHLLPEPRSSTARRASSSASSARRTPACSGPSNFTATRFPAGCKGDPTQPPPPPEHQARAQPRLAALFSRDVLSMPDSWEYPWFAAWDLAFHCVELSRLDPYAAKVQLTLLLREWYMHPNGQIPAYEFGFSDVNPPVHAWAAWRVYKITGARGSRDKKFLESVFQKAAAEFHLVGQPQGLDRAQSFRGRFSRPRQHRRVRPLQDARRRQHARAGGRHGVDGILLPRHAGDRAGTGAAGRRVRGHRVEVLRAFRLHHQGDEHLLRHGPVGPGRRLLLRPHRGGKGRRCAAEGAVDRGADSAGGRGQHPGRDAGQAEEFSQAGGVVHREPAGTRHPHLADQEHGGAGRQPHSFRALARPAAARAALRARRERISFAARLALGLAVPSRSSLRHRLELPEPARRLRAGRQHDATFSAATPTGAGRSGSRSTICSSRRSTATIIFTGTT